jgi:hypothetical protein
MGFMPLELEPHGFPHWLQERLVGQRHPDGEPKVRFEQALREFPMERLGTGVLSARAGRAQPLSDEALGRALAVTERTVDRRGHRITPRRLEGLRLRGELLRRLRAAGFQPHVTHLAAALAFERGLERERLGPALMAFHMANQEAGGRLYTGVLNNLLKSVGDDLPRRALETLHKAPRAMHTGELAQAMGLPVNLRVRARLTDALAVLDLMGLTYKLPPGPHRVYRWIHGCFKGSPVSIPKDNLELNILQRLKRRPHKGSELILPQRLPRGSLLGSYAGLGTMPAISKAFTRLEQSGLVETRPIKGGREAALSEEGRRLMDEQDKLAFLHPELRYRLLGVPREKGDLTAHEARMLDRIERWARVKQVLHFAAVADVRLSRAEVAREAGVKEGFVGSVMQGQFPWGNMKRQRLLQTFLPRLRVRDPDLAEVLRRTLEEAGRK